MNFQPLAGIRVVELGRSLGLAYAGKFLIDTGASVTSIRTLSEEVYSHDASLYVDVRKERFRWTTDIGPSLIEELLPSTDILVTDLSDSELTSLNLAWCQIRDQFPNLVLAVVSPLGRAGIRGTYHSGELAMQAMSGLMHLVGDPNREPLSIPYNLASFQVGLHAAAAATAAVRRRSKTGAGNRVEVIGVEVLASYALSYANVFTYYGIKNSRNGRRSPGSGGRYPYAIFPCKDGYVSLIARSARDWEGFVKMMGNPQWAKDPRYQDLYGMAVTYPEEVDKLVEPWLAEHTRDELLALAQKFQVPIGPVRRIHELESDEQLQYRGFFERVIDEKGNEFVVPGRPWVTDPREPGVLREVENTRPKEASQDLKG